MHNNLFQRVEIDINYILLTMSCWNLFLEQMSHRKAEKTTPTLFSSRDNRSLTLSKQREWILWIRSVSNKRSLLIGTRFESANHSCVWVVSQYCIARVWSISTESLVSMWSDSTVPLLYNTSMFSQHSNATVCFVSNTVMLVHKRSVSTVSLVYVCLVSTQILVKNIKN